MEIEFDMRLFTYLSDLFYPFKINNSGIRTRFTTYAHDINFIDTFSGKRIHRGMYQTASGKCLNADVNGALNIMRKSNVVSLKRLYTRGEVDTPIRIRIA